MKKALIVFLLIAMVIGFASAAGSKESGSAEIPAFDPDKEYTVTIGVFDELLDGYTEALGSGDFKKLYPNINVEIVQGDWDGHHERLVTVIAAGDKANDIEAIDEAYIAGFVTGGGFSDLRQAPYGCDSVSGELAPFALKNATAEDGSVVALPVDIAPAVMFYQKPLTDAAGVSLDNVEDWNHLATIGQKLTVDKDGDGSPDQFLLASSEDIALVALNNGIGCWFDAQGNVMEPKEKFIGLLEQIKRMADTKVIANYEPWGDAWSASYSNQSVVAAISGAWFAGALKGYLSADRVGEWRVAKLPGNAYVNMGGSFLGIPESTAAENKAAAWEVLRYLTTSADAQMATFETMGAFPALKSVWDNPGMNLGEEYFGGQKVRQIYADVAKNIPAITPTEYDPTAQGIWNTALAEVMEGALSPEEAYEQVKSQITAIMD
jgi:multiple sugar transport system substrate-binding protein